MTYPLHLDHAPITEAVIDIRVELPKEIDFAAFDERVSRYFDYSREAPLSENTYMFPINAAVSQVAAPTVKPLGFRLRSVDQKYVALVRLQGLSVSRLPPYEDWQRLKAEFERLWTIYVRQFTPVKITRVATRYINNLRLPLEHGQDFNVFVNTFGQVPPALPQAVSNFANRFRLQDAETKHFATVSVVWRGDVDSDNKVPIVLDVDAYSDVQYDPKSDVLWGTLESLRALKNRCFFGSLTPAAWELYK